MATYDGKRGHPVLIGRSHFDEAMHLTGDEGARSLLAAHDVVEVACDGEVFALTAPLVYRILPRALKVVVPKPPPPESREMRGAPNASR